MSFFTNAEETLGVELPTRRAGAVWTYCDPASNPIARCPPSGLPLAAFSLETVAGDRHLSNVPHHQSAERVTAAVMAGM
jgi:hypothetical protein